MPVYDLNTAMALKKAEVTATLLKTNAQKDLIM
jgi:hypothetical protein